MLDNVKLLSTEQNNPRTVSIDSVDTLSALRMIHEEDRRAREGVERGVEEDRGRYEEVVGRPELARAD